MSHPAPALCWLAWALTVAALLLSPTRVEGSPTRSLSAANTTSPSFVIGAHAERARDQPYPRSVQNKGVNVTFGSGTNAYTYSFTVDTGSGLLEATCRSNVSLANCPGRNLSKSYQLNTTKMLTTAAACTAAGANCFAPGQPSRCIYVQMLTGGQGYNIYKGTLARDVVTVLNTTSTFARTLNLNATFACAEAYSYCDQTNTTCKQSQQTCPTNTTQTASLMQGSCLADGNGIEAGWSFSTSTNETASSLALPEQVFRAGLIQQRVMSFCWQQPQKDADCKAAITPNSATVLGPALPVGINSTAQLQVAPLNNATSGGSSGTSGPPTRHFRTNVTGVAVAKFNSSTRWNTTYSLTASYVPTILWDTGAYGQSIVPAAVFDAFLAYFNASSAQAKNNNTFSILPCGNQTNFYCGSNSPSDSYACQRIALPTSVSNATLAAAKQALLALYPPTINITLQGGALAQLPTAFALNDCTGAPKYDVTAGAAVCSYVRPPPTGTGSNYFWLAGPWFHGRFVSFDLTPTSSSRVGVIRFSGPLPSCSFPSIR